MKRIICLFSFVFIVLSANAQDSINKNLSRSSVSFTGGLNITYPVVKRIRCNLKNDLYKSIFRDF